jgi:hypothetical protein
VTATTPRLKITYATLSADNAELQESFDRAVEWARGELGKTYPMLIGAELRQGGDTFAHVSPVDTDLVVSHFPVGTRQDVRDAIAAARAAFPRGGTSAGGNGSRSSGAPRTASASGSSSTPR